MPESSGKNLGWGKQILRPPPVAELVEAGGELRLTFLPNDYSLFFEISAKRPLSGMTHKNLTQRQ